MNPKLKLRQEQRFYLPFGFKLHQLQASVYKYKYNKIENSVSRALFREYLRERKRRFLAVRLQNVYST